MATVLPHQLSEDLPGCSGSDVGLILANMQRIPSLAARSLTRILDGELAGHVDALHACYERNYIATELVRQINEITDDGRSSRQEVIESFSAIRTRWQTRGGYIEPLSKDDIVEWIRSDSTIVVETVVKLPNNEEMAVAQYVVRLPPAGTACKWLFPMLDEARDDVEDPALLAEIRRAGPSATAVIDFFSVLPEYANNRCAADARFAAAKQLVRMNQLRPPSQRVRYVAGLRFQLRGIVRPGGTTVLLTDFGQSPISNQATQPSRRWPATHLGASRTLKNIPVAVDGQDFKIVVTWDYWVRRVSDIDPDELA